MIVNLIASTKTRSGLKVRAELDNTAILKPILAADAIPCTDGGRALGAAAREMGITHRPVNQAQGIRVIAGVYPVRNVNAYDSRLKMCMSRFHGVATCHLANYLGWRRPIERWGNAPQPRAVLLAALGIRAGSTV